MIGEQYQCRCCGQTIDPWDCAQDVANDGNGNTMLVDFKCPHCGEEFDPELKLYY